MNSLFPVFLFLSGTLLFSCNQEPKREEVKDKESQEEVRLREEEEREIPEAEYSFIADSWHLNLLLIRFNELAEAKAGTAALRDFAGQSAEYHKILQKETRQIAGQYSIDLPSVQESTYQQQLNELNKMQGPGFDIAYLKAIEDLENKMLKVYETASLNATDQHIRNRAVKIVSNLNAHQLAVKELLEENRQKK